MEEKIRTAVIGAGPAGCAAAYELSALGHEVVLFERAAQVGGRTVTWRQDGTVFDTGAAFFLSSYKTFRRYLKELGLDQSVVKFPRRVDLVHGGRSAPLVIGSLPSLLRMPLVSRKDRVKMAFYAGKVTLRYRSLNLADPDTLAAVDDSSVSDEALTHVGRDVYEYLIRPGTETSWFSSCQVQSRALLLGLIAHTARVRFFSLRSGMDSVCRAIAGRVECHAGAEVKEISQAGDGTLRLALAAGAETFDQVVVATTTSVAGRLTANLGEPLVTPFQRRFLDSQRYVPNVHAAYLVDKGGCPANIGAFFPCGSGDSPVAVVGFHSHKQQAIPAGKELVSVALSPDASRTLLEAEEQLVLERSWQLARETCPLLPAERQPLTVAVREEAIPVHEVGRYRLAAWFSREQRGPLVFAGDYLSTAMVEGALASGIRAAQALKLPAAEPVEEVSPVDGQAVQASLG